ncbi:MAG: TatD family hydrolase [Myxococcota bacterium]|nr:TatD family hydrolase [Myxococcota bacterium]
MSFRVFDSHCHIDPETYGGAEGVLAVIETARAAGVERMLTVGAGYGNGSAARAVQVADAHEGVWASVGMHPHDASELSDAVLAELVELASHPKVLAWGEIGLDFYYDNSPREVQREAFRRQIRTALELELPIIIHDRDSAGEVMRVLDEESAWQGRGVLYHCYAGGLAELEPLLERGAILSIPGTVTFNKSTELQEVARRVPADRFLVETDAPFLTPEPLRGRKNEPAHVALTVEFIAGLRGESSAQVAQTSWDNASRFFGLPA